MTRTDLAGRTGIDCRFESPGSARSSTAGGNGILGVVNFADTGPSVGVAGGVPHLDVPMAAAGFDTFSEVWSAGGDVLVGEHHDLRYGHDGEYLWCARTVPAGSRYRRGIRTAYLAAFDVANALRYPHVFRMWNFIGRINGSNADGMEIYRDFCHGRAEAFEATPSAPRMPAATGIGARGEGIGFFFLACRAGRLTNLENPDQVPAYRYPPRYGPRSPSFARATQLTSGPGSPGRGSVFVSGTASILGHETVHVGDVAGQCALALRNIDRLVGRAAPDGGERLTVRDLDQVKVYVRHPRDLPVVRARVRSALAADTQVAYLRADICRSALLVEIEGVVPLDRRRALVATAARR